MMRKLNVFIGLSMALLLSVASAMEIVPRDKVDVASGAARDLACWYLGGIGGRRLAVGQPNLCNRHDKVIFRFDLSGWKRTETVSQATIRYDQAAEKRNADVEELVLEYMPSASGELDVSLLNAEPLQVVSQYTLAPGNRQTSEIDVTDIISQAVADELHYAVFRLSSRVAEKGAPRNGILNCVDVEKSSIKLEILNTEEVSHIGKVLAPDGRAYSAIECGQADGEMVVYAARELREHLNKICGVRLPIIAPGTADKMPVIAVGESAVKMRTGFDSSTLPDESFKVFTQDETLAIAGKDYSGPPIYFDDIEKNLSVFCFSRRTTYSDALGLSIFGNAGTLYGVYDFLEKVGGVRWYMPGPDGVVIQEMPEVQVPELDIQDGPRVNYRYPAAFMFNSEYIQWVRRIRGGGQSPVQIGHSFMYMLQHKEEHPEYFALDANGNRDFTTGCAVGGYGNLCLSNPEVVKAFADDIRDFFKKYPTQKIFPVMPEDGLVAVCRCADCQKEVEPGLQNGKFSRHVWGFVNRVAREIARTNPDKLVGCCAYDEYLNPSPGLVLEPNVAVMICYHRYQMHNPQYAAKIHRIIDTWSSLSKNVYTWNYYLSFRVLYQGLQPGSPRQYLEDYRRLVNSGVWKGEFVEAGTHGKVPGLAYRHLPLYLSCRIMWNPDLDLEKELADYYRLFFGPAEVPMRDFYESAFSRYEKANIPYYKENPPSPEIIYTPEVLERMTKKLEEAVELTNEQSVYRRRIEGIQKEFSVAAQKLKGLKKVGKPTIQAVRVTSVADLANVIPSHFSGRNGDVPEHRTWVSAGWDSQNLYLRFLCFEPKMTELKADYSGDERDCKALWADDTMEIFIMPDIDQPENGFQFAVNPNGAFYDGRLTFGGVMTADWNSRGVTFRTGRKDNLWSLVVTVPFTALEIKPASGQRMLVNFIRNRFTGNAEMTSSCWAPLFSESNFLPDRFGTMILE